MLTLQSGGSTYDIFFMRIVFYFLLLIGIFSCSKENGSKSASSFKLLDSDDTGIAFSNTVTDQEDFNILTFRNYYNGGGVAIGDVNNDGLQDIFFTANMAKNKLYLNKGQMKFEDITVAAGIGGKDAWTTGVTMADVNADGLLDIYVCYSGDAKKSNKENELYINKGGLKFEEKAAEFGLNDPGLSTHASFFDYDLDGDLDCYVLNNSYTDPERLSISTREDYNPKALGGDRLYKNENGKFINVTQEAGIYSSDLGYGLGISVGDVNGDFYPDIYISNDFWERDYLYINRKNGTFSEELPSRMSYTSLASMGSDMADINNDGKLDIFSTDMLPPGNERLKAANKFDDYNLYNMRVQKSYHYQNTQNCLHVNNGEGKFQETSFFSGLSATDWSWGALIFDMDLDGKKDIFVSNGVYHDITDADFVDFLADKDKVKEMVEKKGKYDFRDFVKLLPPNKQRNFAFINQGNLKFENLNTSLGLDQEGFSNGAAYGDLDNDGDQDLVVNNVNMEAFVYQNQASDTHTYISVSCKGPEKNKWGIGTVVKAYIGSETQVLQVMSGRGFQSSVDPKLIFGLNNAKAVDSLRVIWPDLNTELIKNIKANTAITVKYSADLKKFKPELEKSNPIFTNEIQSDAVHIENPYVDYDSDRLMPHVLSTEGPKIVEGDVNADGKIDYILLGAKNMADQLFIGNANGFVKSEQKAFDSQKNKEKTAGALFDIDKDGDLDYLVGMGGNEFKDGIMAFMPAFFENIKGVFTEKKLPGLDFQGQIGCIKPADMDNDGDIDLFIGARSVPGGYGLQPRSYVFRNEGSQGWTDVSNEVTGPLGMVTDACWFDINKDNLKDLVVVGEWMPVTVILNTNGIPDKELPIPNSFGWWNCIKICDYNGDKELDFLIGNWGTNFKLKASVEKPLTAYVHDFDGNRRTDFLMEWYTPGDKKPFPFASKQDLTSQLPSLKKKALKYHEFAALDAKALFSEEILKKALKLGVNTFSSSVLLFKNGDYILEPLPDAVQMSPVFTFEVADFNKDGKQDIFFGGNFYRLKPEIGRLDGFDGGYLKGIGSGYAYVSAGQSGLKIKGEVRDSKIINDKLIVAVNNDKVHQFKY